MVKVLVISCITFILTWCVFLMIRSEITANNMSIIINAIYEYHIDMIYKQKAYEVDYNDMESFDETFKRYLDFGYTKILPKEKYEIIESYINKKESK